MKFIHGAGNWTDYRELPGLIEHDFHRGRRDPSVIDYHSAMDDVYKETEQVIRDAFDKGHQYVMFRHGCSTSSPGQTTARSMVRMFMRSRDATPYIVRSRSIQHETVFVAALKAKK